MAATSQELLDKVNDAISALMTGGAVMSYMIGNKNIMNYPLDALLRLRDQLRKEVNAGQNATLFARSVDAS